MFLLLGLAGSVQAQNGRYEKEKTIAKSFKVDSRTTVEVTNKYGRVDVKNWAKDSVRFEIAIKAIGRKEGDVIDMMNYASFDLEQSVGYVTAETQFGQSLSGLKREIFELKGELSNQKITIDYTVYAPARCRLTINNKFGDVYLGDVESDLRVNLSHGDFRAHSIKKGKKLELSYGSAFIDFIEEAELELQAYTLEVAEAEELRMNSRASEVTIDDINILEVEARNDKYSIAKSKKITGNLNLTNLKVRELTGKVDLLTRYGAVEIRKVSPKFRELNLYGEYTDFTLGFSEADNFKFRVDLQNGREFYRPASNLTVKEEIYTDEAYGYKGFVGAEESEKQVQVKTRSGIVKFDFFD